MINFTPEYSHKPPNKKTTEREREYFLQPIGELLGPTRRNKIKCQQKITIGYNSSQ